MLEQPRPFVDRSMLASRLQGLEAWQNTIAGGRVTVSGTVEVRLLMLGTATLASFPSANFRYG